MGRAATGGSRAGAGFGEAAAVAAAAAAEEPQAGRVPT